MSEMDPTTQVGAECFIPKTVHLDDGVSVGPRVVFAGGNSRVYSGAVIEAAAVISVGVSIGQGALVRAGAVVLHDVPPNAIVAGNPAEVVGYRSSSSNEGRADILMRDVSSLAGKSAPARYDLEVGGSALYLMRRVTDVRGSLTVGEVPRELPFEPARYFIVFDVPSRELRGEHAHYACQQFLICVHGSCRVLLDDGQHRCEVTLDRPDLGVLMPAMVWGTQYRYSPDAVLLVFASLPYDPADYIRSYDAFLAALGGSRK